MNATLILATGSHAGIKEPLKLGYYMIGRDGECQIRPKSHSVSRRHCLLHHSSHGVRVYDLASANGTRVNEQVLEPNEWAWLCDGDQLRCGKIAFRVALETADQPADSAVAQASIAPQAAPQSVIVRGKAWQDFDVVSFLEAEDEAERRQRDAALESQARNRSARHSAASGESKSQSSEMTSIDVVEGDPEAQAVLAEARDRARRTAAGADDSDAQVSARARRIAAIRAKIEANRRDAELNKAIHRSLSRNAEIIDRPLPGSSRSQNKVAAVPGKVSRTSPTHNLASEQTTSLLKLCGAILLATVITGFFGYSLYVTVNGEPARITDEID
jgi:predicted component of type VI protein secretion system